MNNKRHTKKTVAIDIERITKNNALNAEKIAKLQEEIAQGEAKIKELVKIRNSLFYKELQEQLSPVFQTKGLTDDEALRFIEISKGILENIESINASEVLAEIRGEKTVTVKRQSKAVPPTPPEPPPPPPPQDDEPEIIAPSEDSETGTPAPRDE